MAVDVPDWTFSTVALGEVVSLASFVSVGGEASVDFSNISASYSFLELHYQIRSNFAAASDSLKLQLNNDTTDADYIHQQMRAVTTTAPADTTNNARPTLNVTAASALAGLTAHGTVRLHRYADSHFLKAFSIEHFTDYGTTFTTFPIEYVVINGTWNNTVAVNEVTLALLNGALVAGSWALLLGYQ